MPNLCNMSCRACRGDAPTLKGDELAAYASEVPDWQVVKGHHVERTFKFPDFKAALDFVNRVGALAEEEGHHPTITFTWGRVTVRSYTHKVDGLTASDFILAAKVDRLAAEE